MSTALMTFSTRIVHSACAAAKARRHKAVWKLGGINSDLDCSYSEIICYKYNEIHRYNARIFHKFSAWILVTSVMSIHALFHLLFRTRVYY